MRTIIAGSRTLNDYRIVAQAMSEFAEEVTEVVSGCASGVDQLGEQWAKNHPVRLARFPADWEKYGKSAGPIRNRQMAEYADALVAIWDGKSRGTKNMIEEAKKRGLIVFVFRWPRVSP